MSDLVGRTIHEVRLMTVTELAAECWDASSGDCPVVLVLDDGTKLYASRDPEGNGPGALFGVDANGESFGIMPAPAATRRGD
jgi:hypothetical protein